LLILHPENDFWEQANTENRETTQKTQKSNFRKTSKKGASEN
jgi:hypothetical protein